MHLSSTRTTSDSPHRAPRRPSREAPRGVGSKGNKRKPFCLHMPFLLESLPQRVVAAQAVGQGVVLSTFLVSPARNMTSAGEHRGTLLERRGVLVVNSRPVDGTDAAGSEVTGVGSSAFGLKFGGGCNSPAQVRVPASASGQGTVAVGSPVPRPMGGHPNALHHAPPEVRSRSSLLETQNKCSFWGGVLPIWRLKETFVDACRPFRRQKRRGRRAGGEMDYTRRLPSYLCRLRRQA